MTIHPGRILCALAPIVLGALPAAAGTTFTILTPTGPTYNAMSIAGVSGDGKFVVGQMSNNSVFRATRWTADDSVHLDMGLLSGRPYSQGTFLDSNGAIGAADAIDASFNPQIFQWTAPSTRVTLPFMATGTYTYSAGISNDGSVIAGWGGITSATTPQRIDRWTSATGNTIVPLPAGISAAASSVPDQQYTRVLSGNGNFIIGNVPNASPTDVAYRYDATTGISTDLGQMQAGKGPRLTSISDDGSVIIGYSAYAFPDFVNGQAGFIWTQAGGFVSLGLLGGEGDTYLPRFLSGNGKVILGTDSGTNFIWTAQTGMVNFNSYLAANGVNTLGMTGLTFRGISDDGSTIVGMGLTSTGANEGWILTISAVPDPGTGLTSGMLAAGIILRRRRAVRCRR